MLFFTKPAQLTLDLSNKPYENLRVQNFLKVSGREIFSFHQESSTILKNKFSLKIGFEGRSYLIKGRYKLNDIVSFSDNSYRSNKVSWLNIDRILSYQSFCYIDCFTPKKDFIKLEKIVLSILNNIHYNPNLEMKE